MQAAERRRRTWLFLAVHSALEVTSSFCASGMVMRMALMGLGRDGETQQCLVQCRCSVHVRTNRAGMMENTRFMEDPHFLTRLGPGVVGGRLEGGAGQAATCPQWAAPSSERKKPPVSTAPHQPRGRGVSSMGLQSMAPNITVEGIMLEKGRAVCQVWTCRQPSPGRAAQRHVQSRLLLPVLSELREADLCSEKGPHGHANASRTAAAPWDPCAAGPVVVGSGGQWWALFCASEWLGKECALRWLATDGGYVR